MSSAVEPAGGAAPGTGRPVSDPESRVGRRYFVDRFAERFVTGSGIVIICAILAILLVILAEVWPLFFSARARNLSGARLPAGKALAVGVDEYREVAWVFRPDGVAWVPFVVGKAPAPPVLELGGTAVVSVRTLSKGAAALGLSDGRVLPVTISVAASYGDNGRVLSPAVEGGIPLLVDPSGGPLSLFAWAETSSGPLAAARVGPREISLAWAEERTSLVGGTTREEGRRSLALGLDGEIASLAVDGRGEDLFVGTTTGRLARVDLRNRAEARLEEMVPATERAGTPIRVLGFLNGDRTLVAGDDGGGVSSWQLVQEETGKRTLARLHQFEPHDSPVTSFSPSRRDKGFVTGDGAGEVKLRYGTTGRTLLSSRLSGPAFSLAFAPKADGFVAATGDGRMAHVALSNPHPEVTLASLFGKVWYEGYSKPAYVWQSTGGTDDFEAKFSLTPLVYGTLKATFYALVFAIPIALLAALYTSQFMRPSLRAAVKPAVELMAALPSVVLGFVAGLWLAPVLEKVIPGVVLMPIVVPALTLATAALWHRVPTGARRKVDGWEIFLLLPLVLGGGAASVYLGEILEKSFLGGDYRAFLSSALGVSYDQRNSIVVGIAMGFAVIPIIFTVAEDSLSSVPPGLRAGSLALGATRWQTAIRTVLPTASPGIFSAVMIGFGRAVGETMIVLMATGNTPVMDASPFSGFRALSANIAVELPEAPEGGTLFRVLFVAALLLFALTFAVNTAAELVRLRLRKRYRTYE